MERLQLNELLAKFTLSGAVVVLLVTNLLVSLAINAAAFQCAKSHTCGYIGLTNTGPVTSLPLFVLVALIGACLGFIVILAALGRLSLRFQPLAYLACVLFLYCLFFQIVGYRFEIWKFDAGLQREGWAHIFELIVLAVGYFCALLVGSRFLVLQISMEGAYLRYSLSLSVTLALLTAMQSLQLILMPTVDVHF